MRILVLGLGNDLYGDDGVGLHVVRLLGEAWARGAGPADLPAAVDFVETALSGAALLDVVRGYDALVIVDTVIRPHPLTGRIHVLEAGDIRDVPGPSPHYISVPQTLVLGRLCGLPMPGTVKVIGIEAAGSFALGQGLGPEMAAAIPMILAAVDGAVRAIALGPSAPKPRRPVRYISP